MGSNLVTASACFVWWTALMSTASGSTHKGRNVTLNGREQRGISPHKNAMVRSRRRQFSTASTMIESAGSQLRVPPSKTRALGGVRLRSMFSLEVEVRGHYSRVKLK